MDEITKGIIRSEYPILNEAQIAIIDSEAYERGHSAGQAEVNNYALSIAEFAAKLLEAK